MTYSYEIFEEDDDEITIIERETEGFLDFEAFSLDTIKKYISSYERNQSFKRTNTSFYRTGEWVKANYPELMI